MRKIGKKGKMKNGIVITVIGVVLIGLLVFMAVDQKVATKFIKDDTGCLSTTSPTLNIKAYDKETGTALTEATNLWKIKGAKTWTTFTAGTGFEAGAEKTLEVVMGITTTDFTDNAYGQKFEVFVECEENPSIEKEMVSDEIETSLTATFYNNDGDAAAEVYVAGQTQDVSIKLQAGVDEYFGNPYLEGNTNVIVLALNSTEWDAPEKVSIKGGAELKPVSLPQRHSAVAGMIAYAFELPVITEDQTEIVLKLNADDTVAPATDMTASIYAANYFYNSDTQKIESGVENEEGVAVGTDAPDTVLLDFT